MTDTLHQMTQDNNAMPAKPDLRVEFEPKDHFFRLGDLCRYPAWEALRIRLQPKIELVFYPVLAALIDGGLTLLGQTHEYYAGNYQLADEANPLGFIALSCSPWHFAVGLLCRAVVFTCLIFITKGKLATWVSFVIAGLHIFGSGTWLIRMDYGFIFVLLLFSLFRFAVYPRYKIELFVRSGHDGKPKDPG